MPPDLTLDEWTPAHADLTWANVMGPEFCIIDWEDWGTAPRGLDAAALWGNALAVPTLADRVWNERRPDLESRPGRLMALFVCAKIAGPYAHEAAPGWSRRARKPFGSSTAFGPPDDLASEGGALLSESVQQKTPGQHLSDRGFL